MRLITWDLAARVRQRGTLLPSGCDERYESAELAAIANRMAELMEEMNMLDIRLLVEAGRRKEGDDGE